MLPRSRRRSTSWRGQAMDPGGVGLNVNVSNLPGSPQSLTTTSNTQVALSLFLLMVPSKVASVPDPVDPPLDVAQSVTRVIMVSVSSMLCHASLSGLWRLYSNWPLPTRALNPKLTQSPPVVSCPPPVTRQALVTVNTHPVAGEQVSFVQLIVSSHSSSPVPC